MNKWIHSRHKSELVNPNGATIATVLHINECNFHRVSYWMAEGESYVGKYGTCRNIIAETPTRKQAMSVIESLFA